jgi:hypothetical protein
VDSPDEGGPVWGRLFEPRRRRQASQQGSIEGGGGGRPQRLPMLREDWPLGQGVLEQEGEEGRGSPSKGGR